MNPIRQPRKSGRRSNIIRIAIVAVCVLIVAALADLALLTSRVQRVGVTLYSAPQAESFGTTWVFVGSDNRSDIPAGPDVYGLVGDNDYQDHADVVIVAHIGADGVKVFSVPRDLYIPDQNPDQMISSERLTLTLASGPDSFAKAMCHGLGIPVDHFAMVRMNGLVAIVDALGGVDVEFEHPVRDSYSALDIETPGVHHLNGVQALAFARSRHPEYLVNGVWTADDPNQGLQARASDSAVLLRNLAQELRATRNPVTLQKVAWAATGAVTLDSGTSMWSVPAVLDALSGTIPVLPTEPTGAQTVVEFNDQTYQALASYGYPKGGCAA